MANKMSISESTITAVPALKSRYVCPSDKMRQMNISLLVPAMINENFLTAGTKAP